MDKKTREVFERVSVQFHSQRKFMEKCIDEGTTIPLKKYHLSNGEIYHKCLQIVEHTDEYLKHKYEDKKQRTVRSSPWQSILRGVDLPKAPPTDYPIKIDSSHPPIKKY
jgi:hypothetical protein